MSIILIFNIHIVQILMIDVYVYVVSAHAELENTNASSTKKLPKL